MSYPQKTKEIAHRTLANWKAFGWRQGVGGASLCVVYAACQGSPKDEAYDVRAPFHRAVEAEARKAGLSTQSNVVGINDEPGRTYEQMKALVERIANS